MTTPPGLAARALCAAADEALTEASFRTADFAEAERLFTEARELAARDGDRDGEALAITGLGMTTHGRNITRLVDGATPSDADVAAEEELMRRALAAWRETGDAAGTARALFGVSLVFQVLRRDWDGGMPYLWQAFGLAEAVEESGDLYAASEIHRHLGFYYLYADIRPGEAVRQLGHSLALRERLGDLRRVPSALVALGQAELAAAEPRHAAEHLYRAVELARAADLLPWRIRDAEQALAEAEAAVRERATLPAGAGRRRGRRPVQVVFFRLGLRARAAFRAHLPHPQLSERLVDLPGELALQVRARVLVRHRGNVDQQPGVSPAQLHLRGIEQAEQEISEKLAGRKRPQPPRVVTGGVLRGPLSRARVFALFRMLVRVLVPVFVLVFVSVPVPVFVSVRGGTRLGCAHDSTPPTSAHIGLAADLQRILILGVTGE